uniref:Bm560 n=1 Tax=Brugia malayi TaxID=6279 RepID=A0A1I9G3G5_BRUMA|nr:Bm560 [Brugia malayi]
MMNCTANFIGTGELFDDLSELVEVRIGIALVVFIINDVGVGCVDGIDDDDDGDDGDDGDGDDGSNSNDDDDDMTIMMIMIMILIYVKCDVSSEIITKC